MKEELYTEAMAIIFTVDRYTHWLHYDETKYLLDVVQKIVDLHPEISVPPQLISRKMRLLKDTGQYQLADRVATSVLVQAATGLRTGELRLGSFVFEHISGYDGDEMRLFQLSAMATPFRLKGQIKYSLGSHVEAAVYLVASSQICYDSEPRDLMGTAHCLQDLTEIILRMSSKDRDLLFSLITFKYSDVADPFVFAEKCAKSGTELLKEEYLQLKQMRTLANCLLFQATRARYKETFHYTLLRRIRDSFPSDASKLDLESQERVLDIARLIFLTFSFFQFCRLESTQMLTLAKDLYRKISMKTENFDDDNLRRRVGEAGGYVTGLLGDSPSNRVEEENQAVIDYPVLKSMSPIDLVKAYDKMSTESTKICPLAKIDVESPTSFVDPLVTTVFRTSSIQHEPQILKVGHSSQQGSSTGASVYEMSSYRSLMSEPMMEISGFDAPRRILIADTKLGEDDTSDTNRILNSNLTAGTVYMANIGSYYTLDDQWRYNKTLVFVHDQLELKVKGGLRDVIKLQYLYQDDAKGMYVGKRYRRTMTPTVYHNDVIMHQLSRHYVKLFNERLQYSKFANKIHMVPVIYMEILAENGEDVLEVLNVEPYIGGNFTKITNNVGSVNEKSVDSQLLLAFTHFTWCESGGKLMVTDLQGWVFDDTLVPCILTDPAINSDKLEHLGITNMGSEGMRGF